MLLGTCLFSISLSPISLPEITSQRFHSFVELLIGVAKWPCGRTESNLSSCPRGRHSIKDVIRICILCWQWSLTQNTRCHWRVSEQTTPTGTVSGPVCVEVLPRGEKGTGVDPELILLPGSVMFLCF